MARSSAVKELPPPSAPEAEIAFIGSMLIDPKAAVEFSWVLSRWFTHPTYRLAWEAMRTLLGKGIIPDMVTTMDQMGVDGTDDGETMERLIQSVNAAPNSAHAGDYAGTIMAKAKARKCLDIGRMLVTQAYGQDVDDALDVAMRQLAAIQMSGDTDKRRSRSYGEVLEALDADTQARSRGEWMGLHTGYRELDFWTGGIEPGAFVILAGRPGSGKSALGVCIARRIAGHLQHTGGGSVEIVTMEMSAMAQARRLVAHRSDGTLTTRAMRQGFRESGDIIDIQARQFTRVWMQEHEDAGKTLWFSETVFTTEQLYLRAMEAKLQRNLQVLVIDQLDLLGDESRVGETERISQISRALKQLAMKLNIVVLCLAQLNREVEKRADHRPELADLRSSGRLEQDADIVMGLYRPSVYFAPEDRDPAWYGEWAELLGLKMREDQANVMMPLRFIPQAAAYTDWDEESWPSEMCEEYIAARENGDTPMRKGKSA